MEHVTDTKIKLVFFGSGPVAAACLELLTANFEIEAVVTKPKPAHHRGDFPVVELAIKLGLKIYYAASRAELTELFKTKPVSSTLGVVIDYGVIIGQDVIDYFPLGIVNSHFSLLPEWRGADPITFSILSGQKMTGVSIMLIVPGLDEGPLIALGEQPIEDDDTTETLTDKLILLSDALLHDALPKYVSGESKGVDQAKVMELLGKPFQPTHSRKLTKEDGRIDWHKPAEQLEREIRAFSVWPKSYTTLAGKDVIVTEAYVVPSEPAESEPGSVDMVQEAGVIMVTTGDGTLAITCLKPAGKKAMTAREFMTGYGHKQ